MPSPGVPSKVRIDRSRAIVAQTVALLYADFPLEKFASRLVRALVRALNADEAFLRVNDGELHLERTYRRPGYTGGHGSDVALTSSITFGDETLGTLGVRSAHRYGSNDERALEAIAGYIAIAVRNRETVRAVVRPAKRLHRAVVGILAFAVLATLLLLFFGFERVRHIGVDATAQGRGRAAAVAHALDLGLTDADQLASTSAALAPFLTGQPARAERTLDALLASAPRNTVYGAGLWYAPYAFDKHQRLYGPYVHRNWRDRSKRVLTFYWQSARYDYPNHDWYKLAKSTPGTTAFTDPYFDVDLVYVSAVHAFQNRSGQFQGVATVDLTIGTLSTLTETLSAPPGDIVYVTLKNGNVFVFPHRRQLLRYVRESGRHAGAILNIPGSAAQSFIKERYGKERQDVSVPVPYVGWVVHDSMATTAVRANVRGLWFILIAAIVLLWAAALASALSLVRVRRQVTQVMDYEVERSRLLSEVQARAESEARLREAAMHDQLTGVLNRAGLVQHIDDALRALTADSSARFGVLFIDLDRFSRINDRIGRDAGDRLLRDVAQRLGEVTGPRDVLGRYGGDEFVVVKRETGERDAVDAAERIGTLLATPFPVDGQEVLLSASIGIAYGTQEYHSGVDILRDADIAMFEMRSGARARYGVFTPETRKRTTAQARLEAEIHRALERGEFFVVYQPVADLTTMRTVGFEALVRWRHPEQGVLTPADFIPLAERSGSILSIDRIVVQTACRDIVRLRAGGEPVYVAVNMSALHFAHGTMTADLSEIFRAGDLDPKTLRLELTETALLEHPKAAAEEICRLRNLGIRVQIDDFGTGYSSLGYLQQLSIDGLKIDRSFVTGMDRSQEAGAIVRAIVELARVLGLEVVAEGIETPSEARRLREMQVRYGQGFLIARPLPIEEVLGAVSHDGTARR